MYEMLGLYEDALVQYDELDALFTQFVLNFSVGGKKIDLFAVMSTCSVQHLCLYQYTGRVKLKLDSDTGFTSC